MAPRGATGSDHSRGGASIRSIVALSVVAVLLGGAAGPRALAQDPLRSPYGQQLETGLRGLDAHEIAALEAGTGMGLARAAELNSYPGPRHVLDAVAAGRLAASAEQIARVQQIFDRMHEDAVRVGAHILEAERGLEAAFRAGTITDTELRAAVARIAALEGELRAIHLAAHVATRATLSAAQVRRYNELRGYVDTSAEPPHPLHSH